jgi:DNA-binding protein HU-beta
VRAVAITAKPWEEPLVNKAELIEALTGRLGDRKSATTALDGVLSEIQNAVAKGEKVTITGFGVFEKRVRAARTGRNPRTGAPVRVSRTSVPAFRPGTGFKEQVAGGRVVRAASSAGPARKTATKSAAAKKTTPAKRTTAAKKTTPAKKAAARTAAPARKTTTRSTATRTTAARKAPARTTAKRAGSSSSTRRTSTTTASRGRGRSSR